MMVFTHTRMDYYHDLFMDLLDMKQHSEITYFFVMTDLYIYHLIAAVAITSVLNTAYQVAFPTSNTMRSKTLQPLCYKRHAMGSEWSHTCSQSLGRLCPTTQRTSRTMPDSMLPCMHSFWSSRFEKGICRCEGF